jgi:uncharacterized repeat protein (TIGR03803 family)
VTAIANASNPQGGLIQGRDGMLYGTTFVGGNAELGTVFRMSTNGGGFAVVHHFSGPDGQHPWDGLLEASDGALYGTTQLGGTSGLGTVFKLNKDGRGFALLRSFSSNGGDGQKPAAALIEGSDGALYGTAFSGGARLTNGVVFRINKNGSGYTNLYSFVGGTNDGANPLGSLVEGSDGALYGTTQFGGNEVCSDFGCTGVGTIFKINKDGTGYTVLRKLNSNGQDGWYPYAGLIEGSNGLFYGTTYAGGNFSEDRSDSYGTIFSISKDGKAFKMLRKFSSTGDAQNPWSGLIVGSDGVLYGTTYSDQPGFAGSVFKLNRDGTGYRVLHANDSTSGDGLYLTGRLVEGKDRWLYGITQKGGSADGGTVFRVNRSGSQYTVLYSFAASAEDRPKFAWPIKGRTP